MKYNNHFVDNQLENNSKNSGQNDYLLAACMKNNLTLLKTSLQDSNNFNQTSSGPIPLCVASFFGNGAIIMELIANGANVNIKDNDWLTPLHWACLGGHANIVDLLIQNGADINRRDKQWRTPMHCAAINFNSDCFVKVSSKLFKNYTAADRHGWIPLHHACYHGSISVVKLMINEKILINMGDRKERRPLHLASYCGYKNIVLELIANGADCNVTDKRGFTPLHAAACNGHHLICEELLNKNALVNALTKSNNTALHYAVKSNDHSTIDIILRNGADVTIENSLKQKPIHCLLYDDNNILNLELFLPYGHLDVKDGHGMTPLHIASRKGVLEAVKLLLSHNCDPNAKNNSGNTPLHLAVAYNHTDIIDLLLLYYTNKVDINAKNNENITPLHIAVITMNFSIVKKLLNHHASISIADNDQNLPIHSLLSSPLLKWHCDSIVNDSSTLLNFEVFFKLIHPTISLNARNSLGQTPLLLSIMYGLLECAIILLSELKADPSICDNHGRNALHYAIIFGIENEIIVNSLFLNKTCFVQDKYYYTPLHYLLQYCKDDIIPKFEYYSKYSDRSLCLHPISLIHIICRTDYEIKSLTDMVFNFCHIDQLPIDNDGNTPFHILANNLTSHPYTLKLLCQHFPNIDLCNLFNKNGWSPIHVACNAQNIQFMEYLIKFYSSNIKKFNIPTKDQNQYTPAILAAANPSVKLLKFLINNDADLRICDTNRNSPLHYAIITQNISIINLIIKTINDFEYINSTNILGETPLIICCKRKNENSILEMLTSNGALVTCFSHEKYSPIHWLCLRCDLNALQFFSEHTNFVDSICIVEKTSNKFSPPIFSIVHCLIQSKDYNCLKFMLSLYSNFNVNIDIHGRTPLHLAIMSSNDKRVMAVELLNYYVKHHIDFDIQDIDGYTPIMRALQTTTLYNLDKICMYSKFYIQEFIHGNTPLHIAVQEMEGSNIPYIIEYIDKDTINIKNHDGDTPLHIAARLEMEEIVKILLDAGADPTIINNNGETAFNIDWDDDDDDDNDSSD